MNEVQQAEQRGRIEAKLDMLLEKVSELNTTLHGRIDNTNDELDDVRESVHKIQGGIKVLWGVISLIGVLGSGLMIKVFWG